MKKLLIKMRWLYLDGKTWNRGEVAFDVKVIIGAIALVGVCIYSYIVYGGA